MSSDPKTERDCRVFGVLGGIASGKSAVARFIAGERGVVLSADRLAHEALRSPEIGVLLREAFGAEVFLPDGRPDRAALARRVFASPLERRRLEGWIHPRVRERILSGIAEARRAGVERIVLDVPLLLEHDAEHGFVALCDHLIFVDAEHSAREARAMAERGWEPGEVARREHQQLPLAEKRSRADHVIVNRGTLSDLRRSVQRLLASLASE